jgi:hypothetical protein
MPQPCQNETFEKYMRTRRNLLAIGSVLSAVLLSGCKTETKFRFKDGFKDVRPNCYLKGTRILTPRGERRIEQLQRGDFVTTLEGQSAPIEWIARRRYVVPTIGQEFREEISPVRIARDALESGIPHNDLYLSQDHRIYFDGLLVRAADLLNEGTIAVERRDQPDELEYFHIMLRDHGIIFAEGAPCETLLPNAKTVKIFDNYLEYEKLFGLPVDCSLQPYVPVYADRGGRARVYSHLRSAISPWIDRRNKYDKLRDRLLARGVAAQRGMRDFVS